MEKKAASARTGQEDEVESRSVVIVGQRYRWPNGIVPYQIDPNLPRQERVRDALAHWQEKTTIRFVKRNNRNASQHPNYVYFRPANNCQSSVGMRGGKQNIDLANGCGRGSTIHEIAHALGFWHEQSREDRDRHIQIHWENIEPQHKHNFDQHITDGDDHGSYDYDSIMHYHATAFSKNGQPTISTIPPGRSIGQRNTLSQTDIATVKVLYSGTVSESRPYTIQSGDTLYLVAERLLGNGDRWHEIMKTPKGGFFTEEEASNLEPGQVVYLPLS
jgi:astacin